MATITKRELTNRITERATTRGMRTSQQDVADIIQFVIDEISDALAEGDKVVMRKFGSFEPREMKPKIGRNPKEPGSTIKIPARYGVKFKVGSELKKIVARSLRSRDRKRKKTK